MLCVHLYSNDLSVYVGVLCVHLYSNDLSVYVRVLCAHLYSNDLSVYVPTLMMQALLIRKQAVLTHLHIEHLYILHYGLVSKPSQALPRHKCLWRPGDEATACSTK